METSTTKEQAQARRKHFGRQNSDPFYTVSYSGKVVAQDENAQSPSDVSDIQVTEPNKEVPTKELAAV